MKLGWFFFIKIEGNKNYIILIKIDNINLKHNEL